MSGHRAETATRVGLTLGCGGAAFAVSFAHVLEVAEGNGQGGWAAWAIAASVDALALVGGLEIRRSHRAGMPTWPGWGLVLLGVAMTVAANLETAAPTAWGAAMAVWPAVAFLALAGVVERRAPDPPPSGPPLADSVDSTPVRPARALSVDLSARAHDHASDLGGQVSKLELRDLSADLSVAELLDLLEVPRDAGRDRCRTALSAAGLSASNEALAAAIRHRRNGSAS